MKRNADRFENTYIVVIFECVAMPARIISARKANRSEQQQ